MNNKSNLDVTVPSDSDFQEDALEESQEIDTFLLHYRTIKNHLNIFTYLK